MRGEWCLMALCYNFTRVLTPDHSPGLHRFVAYLAKCKPGVARSVRGIRTKAKLASP